MSYGEMKLWLITATEYFILTITNYRKSAINVAPFNLRLRRHTNISCQHIITHIALLLVITFV